MRFCPFSSFLLNAASSRAGQGAQGFSQVLQSCPEMGLRSKPCSEPACCSLLWDLVTHRRSGQWSWIDAGTDGTPCMSCAPSSMQHDGVVGAVRGEVLHWLQWRPFSPVPPYPHLLWFYEKVPDVGQT